MRPFFLGVDVLSARGCPFAVLDGAAEVVRNGWVQDAGALRQVVTQLAASGPVVVGIDAPRMPLPGPRRWSSKRGRWVKAALERGRQCEVVVRCLGLANPQWTPSAERAEPWMQLGFAMFRELSQLPGVTVHEVFPSASYRMFEASGSPRVTLSSAASSRAPRTCSTRSSRR